MISSNSTFVQNQKAINIATLCMFVREYFCYFDVHVSVSPHFIIVVVIIHEKTQIMGEFDKLFRAWKYYCQGCFFKYKPYLMS